MTKANRLENRGEVTLAENDDSTLYLRGKLVSPRF